MFCRLYGNIRYVWALSELDALAKLSLSEHFDNMQDFRQGDLLSYNLFVVNSSWCTLRILTLLGVSRRILMLVNDGKTKYMLVTSKDMRRIRFSITLGNYTFDVVSELFYLGAWRSNEELLLPIRVNIALGNNCVVEISFVKQNCFSTSRYKHGRF